MLMSILSLQSANISDMTASSSLPATSNKTAVAQASGYDTVTISSEASAALTATGSSDDDPYAGMSQTQLQAIHSQVIEELSVDSDETGLVANAAQLPNPATTDSIASAKSATAFVDSGGNTPNPFSSLSRTALTKIIYDQSGTYTTNQRLAAMAQQGNNDSSFLLAASDKSIGTGDQRYIYSALLQLNQQQTPVEKAVSNSMASITTTTTQLTDLLNQANADNGGALTTTFPYPGGWTS